MNKPLSFNTIDEVLNHQFNDGDVELCDVFEGIERFARLSSTPFEHKALALNHMTVQGMGCPAEMPQSILHWLASQPDN